MPTPPRVFLSYSHDSDAHRERVLALSERLRQDGIPTILDRYINGTPPEGWPRWMLDRLDESDRVLLICTPTYYRRFRGHEEPGQDKIRGKGVDWEGAIITQGIYDARSKTIRFIPVLFDPDQEPSVPEPLRGHTRYCLTSEAAYQALYDALLEQAGIEPGPVGKLKPKPRPQGKPLTFDTAAAAAPRIDLAHLPAGAEHFLGRGPELAALDAAWSQPGTAVVELIAPGGTGKTALVKRWLDGLRAAGWGAAVQVYGWSFYSQGTGADRQASEDHFLAEAIKWLGVEIESAANPADKGRALADSILASRTLLILDGLEPLQYPPGLMAGELRAPGLRTLLTQLAAAGQPGLCLVTSREWLQDLGEWVRNDIHPQGPVLRLDLGNLSETDGAALLHARGATRAGAAPIGPDDPELIAASREVQGHALTLALLGRYLARTKGGDIRKRDAVDLVRADQDARGHAAKVVAAYETWFAREGETRSRELAALRLLGFFDRPASRELLDALREAPPIPGLTDALQDLDEDAWNAILANLADCGLAQPDGDSLDAHPLVREHLAETLQRTRPEAWREGHRRLYQKLKASVPHRPEGLNGLQPLYQAVAHGCLAGLYEEALGEIYDDRILRGTAGDGFYSWKKLAAFGANLGALACFFTEPWRRPAPVLSESDQAWLLNEAAIQLRALGRLAEALEPLRAGAEMAVQQEDWRNAAQYCNNLSELQLSLGRVREAVANARRSVEHAERSGDAFQRISSRTTLADALHRQGETREARAAFSEAERMQAERQPQYPLLYSFQGFQYCDLLLAGAAWAAWAGPRGTGEGAEGTGADPGWVAACNEVARRASQVLSWEEGWPEAPLLDFALHHLTLARCALYQDRLQSRPPGPEAREHAERALDRLHASGHQDHIPRGLLTRAWLRHTLGEPDAARADLNEAERIAARGAMALHLADIALTRARLFQDRATLTEAGRLIEEHGYNRRLPELQDAEAAAESWPD
jgi:tetratricopeptide (TPR) repeat protein